MSKAWSVLTHSLGHRWRQDPRFLVSIIHLNVNICTFHVLWDYYLDHHVLGENLINSFILQHHKKYSMIINIRTVEGKNTEWGDRFLDALNPIFSCQIKCFVTICFHRNLFSNTTFTILWIFSKYYMKSANVYTLQNNE